jgi:hypothetical protein
MVLKKTRAYEYFSFLILQVQRNQLSDRKKIRPNLKFLLKDKTKLPFVFCDTCKKYKQKSILWN